MKVIRMMYYWLHCLRLDKDKCHPPSTAYRGPVSHICHFWHFSPRNTFLYYLLVSPQFSFKLWISDRLKHHLGSKRL